MRRPGQLLAAALLCGFIDTANALPLLINGSFEDDMTGWSFGATLNTDGSPARLPEPVSYGQPLPIIGGNQAQGDEVLRYDNSVSRSPDRSGESAVYFHSSNSLYQWVYFDAGRYQIGFSGYTPAWSESPDPGAVVLGIIDGRVWTSYYAHQHAPSLWQEFSNVADIKVAGRYKVEFLYSGGGWRTPLDIVVDRLYVIPVAEPGAMVLMGFGALGLGLTRRRTSVRPHGNSGRFS